MKGGEKIRNTIDVHDLPEEHIKLVQEFIEFLRQKTKRRKQGLKGKRKSYLQDGLWELKERLPGARFMSISKTGLLDANVLV